MNDSLTIRDTIYEVTKFLNVAKKDIWNANKIRDKYVSDIPVEDNQFLLFESFANEYKFNNYASTTAPTVPSGNIYGEYLINENIINELPLVYKTINIIGTTSDITSVFLYPNTTPTKGIEHIIFNSTNNEIQVEYNGLPSFDIIVSENESTKLLYIGSTNTSWTTI